MRVELPVRPLNALRPRRLRVLVRAFDDPSVDVYYVRSGGVDRIVAPFVDTDIQDAGYATTLDAIDFAPTAGWSR